MIGGGGGGGGRIGGTTGGSGISTSSAVCAGVVGVAQALLVASSTMATVNAKIDVRSLDPLNDSSTVLLNLYMPSVGGI